MTQIKVGDTLVAGESVLEVVGVEYGSTEKKHLLESPVIRTIDEFGNHSANLEKTLLADGYVVADVAYQE